MKKLINVLSLLFVVLLNGFAQQPNYQRVKVFIHSPSEFQKLMESGIDLHCQLDRKNLNEPEIWISDDEVKLLQKLNLSYRILIPSWEKYYNSLPKLTPQEQQAMKEKYGIKGFGFGSMGGNLTYAE
ncbi:MAG: hypothetical protein N3A61_02215, partial [Ignavibacteria bacterium]|nr:hypothetical protein [Ignavibacteria bacterium]